MDRLFRSAAAIKINLPFSNEELSNLLLQLLERNKMTSDGKVYLQVTRGSAPRDHVFPVDVLPNIYAYIEDLPRNIANLKMVLAQLPNEIFAGKIAILRV